MNSDSDNDKTLTNSQSAYDSQVLDPELSWGSKVMIPLCCEFLAGRKQFELKMCQIPTDFIESKTKMIFHGYCVLFTP